MENEVCVFQIKLLPLCPVPEGGGYALSVCVYVSPSLYLELPEVVSESVLCPSSLAAARHIADIQKLLLLKECIKGESRAWGSSVFSEDDAWLPWRIFSQFLPGLLFKLHLSV